MTANELFGKLRAVIWMLTDGGIPVTINGKPVEITDVTLEGSNGNYWCDIKISDSDQVPTDGGLPTGGWEPEFIKTERNRLSNLNISIP